MWVGYVVVGPTRFPSTSIGLLSSMLVMTDEWNDLVHMEQKRTQRWRDKGGCMVVNEQWGSMIVPTNDASNKTKMDSRRFLNLLHRA